MEWESLFRCIIWDWNRVRIWYSRNTNCSFLNEKYEQLSRESINFLRQCATSKKTFFSFNFNLFSPDQFQQNEAGRKIIHIEWFCNLKMKLKNVLLLPIFLKNCDKFKWLFFASMDKTHLFGLLIWDENYNSNIFCGFRLFWNKKIQNFLLCEWNSLKYDFFFEKIGI